MSITTEQIQGLSLDKADVYAGSDKVGGVGQVYVDDATGEPNWVTVKTGLFGTSESFVPLQDAEVNGDDIVVRFDKNTIKNAPRVQADGQISEDEESELYHYYGLTASNSTDQSADAAVQSTDDGVTRGQDTGRDTVGHDTSGPTTDDAMTRSEERLDVGTQTREAGRARLRKYVTSETVSQTVPVRHEEVTLQREPITDASVDAAGAGPTFSEEEHEVVLHEEVPVVQKTAVPVERIKLGTETVTEDATVDAELRQEQVELVDQAQPADDTDPR